MRIRNRARVPLFVPVVRAAWRLRISVEESQQPPAVVHQRVSFFSEISIGAARALGFIDLFSFFYEF